MASVVVTGGVRGLQGAGAGAGAGEGLDLGELFAYLKASMQPAAVPAFLRLQSDFEDQQAKSTGTMKFRKLDYVADGYDPERVPGGELLLFRDDQAATFTRIDGPLFARINSGELKF
jgi:fatty-acyl-CoA synthase